MLWHKTDGQAQQASFHVLRAVTSRPPASCRGDVTMASAGGVAPDTSFPSVAAHNPAADRHQ